MNLSRLTSPFRDFGIANGLLYLASRLLTRISRRMGIVAYDFIVQPLPATPIVQQRVLRGFDHRLLGRDDPALKQIPVPSAVIDSRFAQGAICLGLFRETRFIGYIWFAFGAYEEDEVRCTYAVHPPAESVFDFDLYIFPEYRLGFGFVAIWQTATTILRQRGFTQTFSRISSFNLASRRSHERLGAQRIARAIVVKLWRLECMAATLPPYVSLSWVGRPRLVLRAQPAIASSGRSDPSVNAADSTAKGPSSER